MNETENRTIREKPNLPEVWPGWETVRILGHGSFGAVYEIQRDIFGSVEKAAVKCLTIPQNYADIEALYEDGLDEGSITARFDGYLQDIVQEYSLMAQLKGHSNIVNCDDVRYVRQDNGIGWNIYIKMELLTSLPKALRGQVEEAQVIRLGIDICTALELCQSKNIIHRDIKPQNIFISEAGEYKLGDFGIAKTAERTTTGTKTGTYRFMAPEVYNSRPYGAAVDIYSLGLVLYWLLNERRTPFLPLPPAVPTGRMEDEARDRRMKGEAIPEPKNGSEALKAVVLKSVAFEPKERYSDPTEMKQALQALLQPKTAEAPVVEVKEQPEAPEAPAAVVEVQPEAAEVPVAEEEDGTRTVFEPRQPEENPGPITRNDAPVSSDSKDEASKKKKKRIRCVSIICLCLLFLAGYFFIHIWSDGSCTEPVRCKICGKIKTYAPGHSWLAATCTEPETCTVCGTIRSPAHGHAWLPATCTEPEKCSVCGKIGKDALGHSWTEASNGTPKTCMRCGQQVRQVKGYIGGTWGEEDLYIRGDQSTHAYELSAPVNDCFTISLSITVGDYSGNPFGVWYLYTRDMTGEWSHMGEFDLKEETIKETNKYVFEFDSPVTFDALSIYRRDSHEFEISYIMDISDVQQYIMDEE